MSLSPEQTQRVLALARDLARQDDSEELRGFLTHGVPVDTRDDDGNTLLMLAAYHGSTETVRMLLAAGADPDLRNARDQAPITGAMFKGERAVVDLLREAGADLDAGTPTARDAAALFGFDL
jgi:ankyrin repeat protein